MMVSTPLVFPAPAMANLAPDLPLLEDQVTLPHIRGLIIVVYATPVGRVEARMFIFDEILRTWTCRPEMLHMSADREILAYTQRKKAEIDLLRFSCTLAVLNPLSLLLRCQWSSHLQPLWWLMPTTVSVDFTAPAVTPTQSWSHMTCFLA